VQTSCLLDCKSVRDQHYDDRITSEDLAEGLVDLGTRYPWMAYRGPKDDGLIPRKLRSGDVAHLLRNFDIEPIKIRIGPGPKGTKQGYMWAQFERDWEDYGGAQKAGTELKLKLIDGGKGKKK
jgi:hypothetical protein